MRDIKITVAQQKRELIVFTACFIISFALNVGAVISYGSPWTEVFTSLFYVLTFAAVMYAVLFPLRMLVALMRKRNNKKPK